MSSAMLIGAQRVFLAVQYLGCEALSMILVQCAGGTEELASGPSPHFTIGQYYK